MKQGIRNLFALQILSLALYANLSVCADAPNTHAEWEKWAQSQAELSGLPAVQRRTVKKDGHFEIMGPFVGLSDRKDFYTNYLLSAGARYYFSGAHAWEIRGYWGFPVESKVASEIREQTGFRPDAQTSRLQISSSYVFTPIYGKYAWGESSIVHFDLYGTLGAGIRFASEQQPFLETGIGMSHYILSSSISLVPEFRLRVYQEQRTQSTTVLEGVFQLGISWLL